jgi:hypothetical protein
VSDHIALERLAVVLDCSPFDVKDV